MDKSAAIEALISRGSDDTRAVLGSLFQHIGAGGRADSVEFGCALIRIAGAIDPLMSAWTDAENAEEKRAACLALYPYRLAERILFASRAQTSEECAMLVEQDDEGRRRAGL